MSLYTISAIHILMDEFTVDDNLYHPWQHIRPMNVFDHRPKVLSFPIRYHLIVLMLGGQGISKMSIFTLWIWFFLDRFERVLKALVLFLFHQMMLF